MGKDSRSSGYHFGLNDVVLERIAEAPAVAELPADLPRSSVGPVYRGVALPAYLQALRSTSEAGRPGLLRAIGAFGADAGAAVSDVAKALNASDPAIRAAAAWALSQMGPAAEPAVQPLGRALADPDARVRSLSAVALRAMGRHALGAMPDLVKALDNPSPYVRALAADALGNLGSAARPVVEVLSRHLLPANEQVVFVLRSIASALGEIGPQAASALPALEQALKLPRVTYTAQEAIHKIKGEPVSTWY